MSTVNRPYSSSSSCRGIICISRNSTTKIEKFCRRPVLISEVGLILNMNDNRPS